jgi:hypothetical protein
VASASFGSSEFLLGECPICLKQVLTHVDFDADGSELRRCVHCDATIDAAALRWVDGSELESTGYALLEARVCGNGGGCSSGCRSNTQH